MTPDAPTARRRTVAVVTAGVAYTVIGLATGAIAGAAATTQLRELWRLSAFILSGIVVLIHVVLECRTWDSPWRPAALRVAYGAALGGLGLAVAANLHDLSSPAGYRPAMLLALVAWPLLTGIPALVASAVLGALLRRSRTP